MRNRYKQIELIRATIITILAVIVAFFTALSLPNKEEVREHTYRPQDMAAPVPTCTPPTPTPKPNRVTLYNKYVIKGCYLDEVSLPDVKIELTSLGYYFITSYCPYECGGSWSTASGVTCHRASYYNRITEPTTCAIDRSLHQFGDLFYISEFDRVFIGEDTGSAVKSKHLDLFYEEYDDVLSFPTGWYEVFSVEYVYGTRKAEDYDIIKYINKKGLIL